MDILKTKVLQLVWKSSGFGTLKVIKRGHKPLKKVGQIASLYDK